jgi:nitroreductase
MEIFELLKRTRTYRRFKEEQRVSSETLIEIVSAVRFCPSPHNLQPLEYCTVTDRELCNEIYPLLRWAAYLKNWEGPSEGERPCGYIVMMNRRPEAKFASWDFGLNLQVILLAAQSLGLGACTFLAFKRAPLKELLEIPEDFEVISIIALGVPAEEVVIVDTPENGSLEYWRDENDRHLVPKRASSDFLFKSFD